MAPRPGRKPSRRPRWRRRNPHQERLGSRLAAEDPGLAAGAEEDRVEAPDNVTALLGFEPIDLPLRAMNGADPAARRRSRANTSSSGPSTGRASMAVAASSHER